MGRENPPLTTYIARFLMRYDLVTIHWDERGVRQMVEARFLRRN
jgi:hypothetical protein